MLTCKRLHVCISLRFFSNTPVFLNNSDNIKDDRDRSIRLSKRAIEKKMLSDVNLVQKLANNRKKLAKATDKQKLSIQRKEYENKQRKRQEKHQIAIDKEASVQTKGAFKRKMSAITKWAKKEHPEIWERIVSKISLKESLKGHAWEPAILLVSLLCINNCREIYLYYYIVL